MSTKRNYFAGVPIVTGWDYGKYLSKSGAKPAYQNVGFSGNESAYGRAIPLVYGKCRLADSVLLVARPEGTFMSSLWAICEGPLATNATSDDQSVPANAF